MKNVVFTGFRDEKLKILLDKKGIDISDDINVNTIYVVSKDLNKSSNKIEKAKKKNIKIVSYNNFIELMNF